ncbi:DNA topoisomerase IB [Streptomyces sp. cg28]|uniref:DNA topoisomerase IB n=1 Tax=Streptomyces sp. cg28 TaxID=3403457 RepID=UPI003B21B4A7
MRLRTSRPDRAGWIRQRAGNRFRYRDAHGHALPAADRTRIEGLVIPPAWEDVWICPYANGHIQAMGTDAAGRRQYLYHPDFRAQRDLAKHAHVREVSVTLKELREQVGADLAGRGLSRDRVLACLVRLLDLGYFRIGSAAYAREHQAYGLTTLLRTHVDLRKGAMHFAYPAKSGVDREWELVDAAAFPVVRRLQRRPGEDPQLFAYLKGRLWQLVQPGELNERLRELSGAELTAKDFRTWHATVLAAVGLAVSERAAAQSETARRRAESQVVREVARYLGNTPAVCRASYIDPRLFELFADGRTIAPALSELGAVEPGQPATHGPIEDAVREFLA